MELAVITDEISQDLDHALDVMAEYGVSHAEIRGAWNVNIADASDAVISRIEKSARSHGANVVGLASPIFKCDLPDVSARTEDTSTQMHGAAERTFDEQIKSLQRCIDIALILNTRFIRVFTFFKHGDLTPEIEEQVADAFQQPAVLAAAAGVVLLVENEHTCYYGTGVDTARLLKRINSPAVQSVWDPGNAWMASEVPFPDGYSAIKQFVSHVHVKDANNDHQWTVVGEGGIDWPGQLKALKSDGYTGYLSLETHYKVGGDSETSSRQCLEGLIRLAERAS